MSGPRILYAIALLTVLAITAAPAAVEAVEYRLRVAALDRDGYFHYAQPDGGNSASPFSLRRLRSALDRGEVPSGALAIGRELVAADPGTAQAFHAVAVTVDGKPTPGGQWRQVRWDGRAGDRAVWVVQAASLQRPAVAGVALPGPGDDFRHWVPYGVGSARGLRVPRIPLEVVWSFHGRDGLWPRWLAPRVDGKSGIIAVVGENPNWVYPDTVFVVIEQPAAPTTFDVVIGWGERARGRINPFFEGPGDPGGPSSR